MSLTLEQAYERWAPVYPPEPHNPVMDVEQRALLALCGDLQGRDVLDLACGSGRYGAIAAANGARSVVGLDRSVAMLARAVLPLRRFRKSPLPAGEGRVRGSRRHGELIVES